MNKIELVFSLGEHFFKTHTKLTKKVGLVVRHAHHILEIDPISLHFLEAFQVMDI